MLLQNEGSGSGMKVLGGLKSRERREEGRQIMGVTIRMQYSVRIQP
jgi:hypothetical protein